MFDKLWNSIKTNHFAQMSICCTLPVVIIMGAQLAGFSGWWIYPFALVVCLGSHVLMSYFGFKDCHTDTKTKASDKKLTSKEESKCH